MDRLTPDQAAKVRDAPAIPRTTTRRPVPVPGGKPVKCSDSVSASGPVRRLSW